jgi:hypothetical protein
MACTDLAPLSYSVKGYLREFAVIHRWCDISDSCISELRIALAPEYRESACVTVLLSGVGLIEVDQLHAGACFQLDILDITDRGWDGMRYDVQENGDYSTVLTHCRDVSVHDSRSHHAL